jgi:site-specific DNA-adenine methylase
MKNKKQVKTTTKRAMLLVCVYVCVRAQTEQLSGVVDGLRKEKERKEEKKKKKRRIFYSLCDDKSLSVGFFFTSRSNSSRGPLFVNIHMERTRLLA